VVGELEGHGHDTELARELLQTFKRLQEMHVEHAERFKAQLAALSM
jgi:hypothetical protein